ncbi:hypothetical protein P153DRAFT_405351 [Dothidotthia symphoricarpi CBS 119687]|uniref:Uncharacterized protein n=1 Tax=Dothidotthia symphoricarpi CBS 119687 TaxID=1392245 RepID=A0A6A6ABK7_9PLEO|nr:uncharacterized protein P153DRAFT_405351 [Dothidotthia symphoricarpi CBS 119687]KAF2128091.1 hypothetical protein P153DRAFT_405351 [Dothidotthia symphoricarpi CBS 119687]
MLSVFRDVEISIVNDSDTIVDVEARRVVLHCTNRADTDAGKYRNEYVFILTINEDSRHVDKVVEFIDAAYTMDFKRRIGSVREPANSDNGEQAALAGNVSNTEGQLLA